MTRLDEGTTFDMIEIVGRPQAVVGHFRLARAVGELAYAPSLFVVEDGGAGRVWPLAAVTCLHPTDPATAAALRKTAR